MKLPAMTLGLLFSSFSLFACGGDSSDDESKNQGVKGSCAEGCARNGECGTLVDETVAECTTGCEDFLQGNTAECIEAYAYADGCVANSSCEALQGSEACVLELFSILTSCPDLLLGGLGDLQTDADCCNEENSCGWNGDGFCDCDGAYAWDADDCG